MLIRLMNKKHRYIHIETYTILILECVNNLENNALSFFFFFGIMYSVICFPVPVVA